MASVRHIKAVFFVITDVKRIRTLKRNDHERKIGSIRGMLKNVRLGQPGFSLLPLIKGLNIAVTVCETSRSVGFASSDAYNYCKRCTRCRRFASRSPLTCPLHASSFTYLPEFVLYMGYNGAFYIFQRGYLIF